MSLYGQQEWSTRQYRFLVNIKRGESRKCFALKDDSYSM